MVEGSSNLDVGMAIAMITALRNSDGRPRSRRELVQTLFLLLLPSLLRHLAESDLSAWLGQLLELPQRLFSRRWYIRDIEYITGGNTRVDHHESSSSIVENTDRNNLLQKAIRLFVANKYNIDAESMETNLVPTSQLRLEKGSGVFGQQVQTLFSGSYKQLQAFTVHMLPKKGEWTLIDEAKGIWFLQNRETYNAAGKNAQVQNGPVQMQTRTTISIKAQGPSASQVVEDWIKAAFDWYRDIKRLEQDDARYLLTALPLESEDKSKPRLFKRHVLADNKSFASLWFPGKDSLLQLVNDFQQKRGKFSVVGFPHKLGLLLHGPPGTGKTSLIKAIAHHTDRHVVTVNLAQIKTNRELMDLMFDLSFPIQGAELPLKLDFKDVIFVMEDIDAASKVVFARKGAKVRRRHHGVEKCPSGSNALEITSVGGDGQERALESPDKTMLGAKQAASEDEEEYEEESQLSANKNLGVLMGSLMDKCFRQDRTADMEDFMKGPVAYSTAWFDSSDELNLAGLLNVLDGVVDTPGRIVVMTTNHPDKLDAALVRPGRINKRLHLGFLDASCLQSMVEHYLQLSLDDAARQRLAKLAEECSLTPAEVEQYCAETHDLESFLEVVRTSSC